MSLLDIQIESGRFTAAPVKAAMLQKNSAFAVFDLLYAAHRLLRLSCGFANGFDSVAARAGDFKSLAAGSALHDDAGAALESLLEAADEVLDLELMAARSEDDWKDLLSRLSAGLSTLAPQAVRFRLGATDESAFVHIPAGPAGTAVKRDPDVDPFRTVTAGPDGLHRDLGPALRPSDSASPPEPLLPWPLLDGAWETADGKVVDEFGEPMAPVGAVNAERSLGRILAWHAMDSWATAETLTATGHPDAAAEFLMTKTAGSADWQDPAFIQKLHSFLSENGMASEAGPFAAYAVRNLRAVEEAARAAADWSAVAETLIVIQQFQAGRDRSRTLERLSNVYAERLEDSAAARLCMIKALEAAPDNADLLAEVLEILHDSSADESESSDLSESAGELMKAAGDLRGREGGRDVLAAAAALFERAGKTEQARVAHAELLDEDPNSVDSFLAVVAGLSDAAAIVEECRTRLKRAWTPQARGIMQLTAGRALILSDRACEAAGFLREAAASIPDSVEVLDLLAAALKETAAWPALLGVMKKRAEMAPDHAASAAILLEAADIAISRMDSPVTALGLLQDLPQDCRAGCDVLKRMHEIHVALRMWKEAAEDLELLCASDPDPTNLVELGLTYRDRLNSPTEAVDAFKKALKASDDPSVLVRAAKGLITIPEVNDDDGSTAVLLNRALGAASDDTDRALILKGLAGLNKSSRSGSADATRHLEEALRLNPLDVDAARRLASIFMADGLAEKAVTVLEPPARAAAAAGDRDTETQLRRAAAEAALQCRDGVTAARHLEAIACFNAQSDDLKRMLARAWMLNGDTDRAANALENVTFSRADTVLLRELGRALTAAGKPEKALIRLSEAWDIDPDTSETTLRELVETAAAAGDSGALTTWLKRLVEAEERGARRFSDLVRLGDTLRAAGDLKSAREWYMAAAGEGTSRKVALHRALEASVEMNDFSEARGLLMSILEEEQDDLKKSDYHFASAMLARDNLNDADLMLVHLNKAIEHNPDNVEAAQLLESTLENAGRFEELAEVVSLRARHYRMESREDRLAPTLRRLADIYENGLHNARKAADVFRQILASEPADIETLRRLAGCLSKIPGAEMEAVDTLRKVVAADPTSVESYRALRDIAILVSNMDLAGGASSALLVLGQGDDSDRHLATAGRSGALRLKRDQIPSEAFDRWISFDVDPGISRVFAILGQPLAGIVPFRRPADFGLNEQDRIDMSQPGLFQNMATAVGRIFDLELPVFWHLKGSNGIRKAPFAEKSVLVGEDFLTTRRGKDLRYSLARVVTSFHPGWELCGTVDAASMRLFFLAALKTAFAEFPIPGDAAGAADFVAPVSKALKEPAAAELKDLLGRFRRQQRPVDLPGFMRAVDMATARAGMFMASDLEVAAARTLDNDMVLSDTEPEDRLVSLCAWTVSSEYAELRRLMLVE